MKVKFVNKQSLASKYIGSPLYSSHRIINEDLIAVFMKPETVTLSKNYAIGFTVLERAKEWMFRLFYDYIQPVLGPKAVKVVFSDTDSFLLHVKGFTKERVLELLEPISDMSNQPKDSPLFSTKRQKQVGYIKDESPGECILEVVAPKSKVYALKLSNSGVQKKCKGLSKNSTKKLTLEQYKSCIEDKKVITALMHCIRSKNHVLHSVAINKASFNSFDDKRFLLNCGKHSVPYGSIYQRNGFCPECCK